MLSTLLGPGLRSMTMVHVDGVASCRLGSNALSDIITMMVVEMDMEERTLHILKPSADLIWVQP